MLVKLPLALDLLDSIDSELIGGDEKADSKSFKARSTPGVSVKNLFVADEAHFTVKVDHLHVRWNDGRWTKYM